MGPAGENDLLCTAGLSPQPCKKDVGVTFARCEAGEVGNRGKTGAPLAARQTALSWTSGPYSGTKSSVVGSASRVEDDRAASVAGLETFVTARRAICRKHLIGELAITDVGCSADYVHRYIA